MKKLLEIIGRAFSQVVLDDGVSLKEAHALAYRLSNGQRQRLRDTDERSHWEKVSKQNLEKYSSALPFFDAKGFLFHLPAYMCYLVRYHDAPQTDIEKHVILSLIPNEDNKIWFIERFSLFNIYQREAIVTFLHWKKLRVTDDIASFYIEKALNYWQ